jgi:hypothetical protein
VAAVNTTTQEETRMAQVTELQVGFRKTVSDGNYGNEMYEARLTVTVAEGESAVDWLRSLSTTLEDHVNSRFRQSSNEHIRSTMETTEERQARYKRESEELEARLAAQTAREVGGYFVGGEDEDDEDDDERPF